MFFADLARCINLHLQMEFMGISSYGNEQKTSGIVRITKDIDTSITGKHVIIAEDIMDSGLTLSHLMKLLSSRSPASLKICCLLDKPSRRECDITPDYCGFEIPNEFVVGYGLDYNGFLRNCRCRRAQTLRLQRRGYNRAKAGLWRRTPNRPAGCRAVCAAETHRAGKEKVLK
jgi:hypoxanthine phosphoribosyltransferase